MHGSGAAHRHACTQRWGEEMRGQRRTYAPALPPTPTHTTTPPRLPTRTRPLAPPPPMQPGPRPKRQAAGGASARRVRPVSEAHRPRTDWQKRDDGTWVKVVPPWWCEHRTVHFASEWRVGGERGEGVTVGGWVGVECRLAGALLPHALHPLPPMPSTPHPPHPPPPMQPRSTGSSSTVPAAWWQWIATWWRWVGGVGGWVGGCEGGWVGVRERFTLPFSYRLRVWLRCLIPTLPHTHTRTHAPPPPHTHTPSARVHHPDRGTQRHAPPVHAEGEGCGLGVGVCVCL